MPRLTREEAERSQRLAELDRLVRLIAEKRAQQPEPPRIKPGPTIPPPRPWLRRLFAFLGVRS